jgi:hypothetical protein
MLWLEGMAGSGKSVLMKEARLYARKTRHRVMYGCPPYLQVVPTSPLQAMYEDYTCRDVRIRLGLPRTPTA